MQGVNIYTEEGAWTGFRWGPTPGTFYDNTQFPKDYVEAYIKQIQPAYRNLPAPAVQVENNAMRDDLRALVDRIGPCILLGWSTGSTNVMQAASSPSYAPKVKGLIGIEGFQASSDGDPNVVKTIPQLTVIGDHSNPTNQQAWSATINGLRWRLDNRIPIPDDVWDRAAEIVLREIRGETGIPNWLPKLPNGRDGFEKRVVALVQGSQQP